MLLIKSFGGLSRKDVAIAGGKGASLGEMTRAGIPVPPGFVVLAGAFDEFLAEADLAVEIQAKIKKVNHGDINSVTCVSSEIRDLINDAEFPKELGKIILSVYRQLDAKFVAVRSSATAEDSAVASWAGELESYLNTGEGNLLENIKKCWASLFTPRAIFYRFEKELQDAKVSVAVVVQEMIQSEVSGVCFTVHPVTEDDGQMVIEAGYGLGEAIVGGRITPDSFVIDKLKLAVSDKNISKQEKMVVKNDATGLEEKNVAIECQERQKLSNIGLVELAKICVAIERHYGKPQDIEWAMEDGKFFILQSRPITTLSAPKAGPKKQKLFLLGAWEEPPLVDWDWLNEKAVAHFKKLTGIRLRTFSYLNAENKLHYHYFLQDDTDRFYKKFSTLSIEEQADFIRKVYADYELHFKKVDEFAAYLLKTDFSNEPDGKLKKTVETWAEILPMVTMQIWFAFLIDNWYPDKDYLTSARELAIKSRDKSGYLQERLIAGLKLLTKEISRRVKIAQNDLYYLFPDELILVMGGKPMPDIGLRKKFFVTCHVGGKCRIFEGEKANSIIDKYDVRESNEENIVLKGQPACPGAAVGKVRLSLLESEFEDFEEGDILVSLQTSVRHVQAMKKAKAVLTELGGITSHAAIVSRELKKPCIVGIDGLTKSVRTGDLVEVDATIGVIKILKKV